jgi:FkbM family methyltransferase
VILDSSRNLKLEWGALPCANHGRTTQRSKPLRRARPKLLTIDSLAGVAKPEYLLRPHQIARRLWVEAVPKRSQFTKIRLPWGYPMMVNPAESIGWAIYSRGIYEMPLTEALWRLAQAGDIVVDGGANIGYATSILAARVGPRGKVHSFEPDPHSFGELQRNVAEWEERGQRGAFVLHQAALGAKSGTAILQVPASFEWNGGRARIENAATEEEVTSELDRGVTKLEVKLVTLDDVFSQGEHVSVVKLDVEGFELDALMGMEQMLRGRRIRYVVFEELRPYPAPTHDFLRDLGYSVFGLDHGFFGIKCCPDKGPRAEPVSGLPPNYVATHEPDQTVRQLEHGLWKSFGPGRYL